MEKSVLSPHLNTEKLSMLSTFSKDKILCVHCRRASKNVSVAEENVHPFELKNLIGIHNGTLWFEGESPKENVESRESDSLRFLTELSENMDTIPNFELAFEKTMEKVCGKFAFIIWDKKAKVYRVIRGTSALLYFSVVFSGEQRIGIFVNTELQSMKDIINLVQARFAFSGKEKWKIRFSEPSLLDKETIYTLDGFGLDKTGVAKEHEKSFLQPKQARVSTSSDVHDFGDTEDTRPFVNHIQNKNGDAYAIISDFMFEYNFSLFEIDVLFRAVLGRSIFETNIVELTLFANRILGYFKPSNNIRRLLDANPRLKYLSVVDSLSRFENLKLSFPLSLMKPAELKAIKKKL